MAKAPTDAKPLQRTLQELFDHQPDDRRLHDHLEGARRDRLFPALTWFWGPYLYQRNRAAFRPLILNHFSEWIASPRGRWSRVPWSEHGERLESWLGQARQNRDTALVRRLLRWKFAAHAWGLNHKAWNEALLTAYRAAPTPAARAIVLNEFDDYFQLDEDAAVALYAFDRAASKFILRHLPHSLWGGEKRKPWPKLAEAAARGQDQEFVFALYRRMTPLKTWQADVLELARSVADPDQLNAALERRHLEGFRMNLEVGIVELLETRGRDVMPYVRRKLDQILGGWFGEKAEPIVKLAESRGWWDLWSAAIRVGRNDKLFNKAVAKLLSDASLSESDRVERLRALAGVSWEWNWPGLGLAQVHGLQDDHAVTLYQRFPELIHGPFKPHVTPRWWQGFPKLLKAAQEAGDDDLVDLLASRYATRARYEHALGARQIDAVVDTADDLGRYYEAIRDRDSVEFARRAANVLTRIPAYCIFGYRQLLKTNHLARLLFVRSFDAFLGVPRAVQDLVEGSDIHVQMLAYRVLAQDDDRARALAVANLDILIGTLLRPLHRKTRLPAFEALTNAARADAQAARRILERAREALRLPDKKYPKEQLVGLIGRVLHVRPELRSDAERPVIYGLETLVEATA